MRFAALILSVLLLDCSASYYVLPDGFSGKPGRMSYEELNGRAKGAQVRIVPRDTSVYFATNLNVRRDSTDFTEQGTRRAVRTSDVAAIETISQTGGALEGLLIGSASGGILFHALHAFAEKDEGLWGYWIDPIAGNGAVRGIIVGGFVGVLLGWNGTHKDTYYFNNDSTTTKDGTHNSTSSVPPNKRPAKKSGG